MVTSQIDCRRPGSADCGSITATDNDDDDDDDDETHQTTLIMMMLCRIHLTLLLVSLSHILSEL